MAAKKKGLGRGLDLLIPEGNNTKQSKTEKESKPIIKEVVKEVVKEVKVPAETFLKLSDIEPNREQPRKNFDKEALEELADSIKQYGLIQPIVVQKKDDYYEIIAGERRWRAAKIAKLNNTYRYRLSVKCKNSKNIRNMFNDIQKNISKIKEYKDISVSLDINPCDLN